VNDAVGNKGSVDLLTIGLVYIFGDSKPVPKAAAQPEPVPPVAAAPAPVPAQKPVLVIVPIVQASFQVVEEFQTSRRGTGGFGSSGSA